MSNILYVAFYLPVVVPAEQAGALNITLNYELSVNFLNQPSIPSTAQYGAPPPGPTLRRRNPNTMNVPTRSSEPPPYPFPRRRKDLLEGPAPGCKIRYGALPPLGMMPRRLYASKIGDCPPAEEEEVESKIHYGSLPPLGMMPRRRNPSTFGVPPVEVEDEDEEENLAKVHYGNPPAGPVARRLNPHTLYAPMMHYGIPPPGRYPRRRNPLKLNTPSVPKLHSRIPPVGRLDPVKLATRTVSLPRRCALPPSRLRLRPRLRPRTSRFALRRRGHTSNLHNTRA
ncbi:hypothetical protein EXIGLDRAFT_829434 [Exidia glandulosa HHB12029]|uniref:Uncharacterized protein n=1 Tax=Exidia glandulosa HHB12029 TaxID=1314781 RepID=A0A165PIH1_EXIGL|nr:hypothetical protein EXIGLDRAFT_829434 [Exidia glandulosa HHB12029]